MAEESTLPEEHYCYLFILQVASGNRLGLGCTLLGAAQHTGKHSWCLEEVEEQAITSVCLQKETGMWARNSEANADEIT